MSKSSITPILIFKFGDCCSEPLLCKAVDQKLLLPHFYFFKHELSPCSINIHIENRLNIQSPTACLSVKEYTCYLF